MYKKKLFIPVAIITMLISIILLLFNQTVYGVEESELIPLPADLETGSEIVCVVDQLNLRSTPAILKDNVLTVLKNGEILIFLNFEGTKWVRVQTHDNIIGYCSAKYVLYRPRFTATSTPIPTIKASSSPSTVTTPNQTPPVTSSNYIDTWKNKSTGEKLGNIPPWLYVFVGLGLLIIGIFRLISIRRK